MKHGAFDIARVARVISNFFRVLILACSHEHLAVDAPLDLLDHLAARPDQVQSHTRVHVNDDAFESDSLAPFFSARSASMLMDIAKQRGLGPGSKGTPRRPSRKWSACALAGHLHDAKLADMRDLRARPVALEGLLQSVDHLGAISGARSCR